MKPNWRNAPKWARYLVCDAGDWYWCECKPRQQYHGGFDGLSVWETSGHHRSRLANEALPHYVNTDAQFKMHGYIEKRGEAYFKPITPSSEAPTAEQIERIRRSIYGAIGIPPEMLQMPKKSLWRRLTDRLPPWFWRFVLRINLRRLK